MKKCGWKVCLPSGEPIFLARNCVKFGLPNSPGSVTLIDSFSYVEAHVKALPKVCQKMCSVVRQSILDGIDAASNALHYNNDKPVISIFCPHEGETLASERHYAVVYTDSMLWCCSKNIDLGGDLKPSDAIWLSTTSSTEISTADGEHNYF